KKKKKKKKLPVNQTQIQIPPYKSVTPQHHHHRASIDSRNKQITTEPSPPDQNCRTTANRKPVVCSHRRPPRITSTTADTLANSGEIPEKKKNKTKKKERREIHRFANLSNPNSTSQDTSSPVLSMPNKTKPQPHR
ncbi:hypothetical protein TorRG33x02_063150, partial [Trema orientale]